MSFGSAGGKRKGFGSADFPLVGGDGFNSETAQHVEDPIYRGTLHALQDWYQQLQSQAAAAAAAVAAAAAASWARASAAATAPRTRASAATSLRRHVIGHADRAGRDD
jgi:hypothetical protein